MKYISLMVFFAVLTNLAVADIDEMEIECFDEAFFSDLTGKGINLNNIVFKIAQNTTIPLKLLVTGSLFRTEQGNHINLRLLQNIYIKVNNKEINFSLDKVNWVDDIESFLEMDVKMDLDRTNLQKPSFLITANVQARED